VKRLIVFIALSLALHLLLKSGLFNLADQYLVTHQTQPETEIEVLGGSEPELPKVKPLIKQLDPIAQRPVDDKTTARFDSEKTQRVQHETKTQNLGLTRNQTRQQPQRQNPDKQETVEKSDTGELPEFTRMNLTNPNQIKNQDSAISQVLPDDIQFSDATNLNTDANTYYSFYNRVEELFYVRWAERLDYYWSRLAYDFKKNQLSGKVWFTTIEVWLNLRGEYHSAYIKQSSGYRPFDEAAVFAFKDAKFFPNPPKAKIEPDGFVRLRYRLAVRIGRLP
jgi:TonB family protein